MKFQSKTNVLTINYNGQNVMLNNTLYAITKIDLFQKDSIKLNFDVYTIKVKDKIMTLTSEEYTDTLIMVQETAEKKFSVKRGLELLLGDNTITLGDNVYKITSTGKIGSTDVYNTEGGTLLVSNSKKRVSTWNGVSVYQII